MGSGERDVGFSEEGFNIMWLVSIGQVLQEVCGVVRGSGESTLTITITITLTKTITITNEDTFCLSIFLSRGVQG